MRGEGLGTEGAGIVWERTSRVKKREGWGETQEGKEVGKGERGGA